MEGSAYAKLSRSTKVMKKVMLEFSYRTTVKNLKMITHHQNAKKKKKKRTAEQTNLVILINNILFARLSCLSAYEGSLGRGKGESHGSPPIVNISPQSPQ